MLSVILIWLYMSVTSFLLGFGVMKGTRGLLYRHDDDKQWCTDSYLICGFAVAAIYAQTFSLFAPVGLWANIVLGCICLIIILVCRDDLIIWMKEQRSKLSGKTLWVLLWIGLILLYAYGSSRGISHYDTGLYHAQSIRWIETYGVVNGLGNLHSRLAYNSASFALSALYSMAFLGGQSYHACVGFLALILAAVCLEIGNVFREMKLQTSSFARVMGFYYLFAVFDEMVSPASDYFMVLIAFYIVIRWMDLLEKGEKEVFPYAMLCVLCVFLLTIKLSAALIVLLTIKPAVMLIQEKKWKEIPVYLVLGIVTALPFLFRNVLISGWLIYPFTAVDWIRADWKIPKEIAVYDAREISVWGRGYSDVARYDIPVTVWLPDWFSTLGGTELLLVSAAIFSTIVILARMAWKQIHGSRTIRWNSILLEGVMALCFWFWLLSSPLMRYGCVYVYLVSAVLWGDICREWIAQEKDREGLIRKPIENSIQKGIYRKVHTGIIVMLGIFLIYKAAAFIREQAAYYVDDYWVNQQDYEKFDTQPYEIEGITFYVPEVGDRTGYDSFPSSPTKARIKLRGDTLRDGFIYQ